MSDPKPIALCGFLLALCAPAQWLDYREPGVPRLRDGKLNLNAPAPRTLDRKPDLSGVWMHELTPVEEVVRLFPFMKAEVVVAPPGMEAGTQHKYAFNILADIKDSPVRPETARLMRERAKEPPPQPCAGVPQFLISGLLSEPIKIVQSPKITMILYEAGALYRQIYSDGRKLPKEFAFPAFSGYSVGHWERDVFIVETSGFNDKLPLDIIGHPRSESMKMTERFKRVDFGHLDLEVTFDDPVMYTKPFTVKIPYSLLPDSDIFEAYCENEKDAVHLKQGKN